MPSNGQSRPARLVLRHSSEVLLDDVVVSDVGMFRAEMLNEGRLWLCCYLPGTGVDGDRITFEVVARGDRLEFELGETPAGEVSTDRNS
jgi:hypothetical protein